MIGQQNYAQNKNVFGAMVGTNISSLSNYEGKASLSVTCGLYLERKYSDSFSLQSYFLYSQRGEREGNTTLELRLEYVNLPIMIKYYVTDDFQVMAGVYWDLLLAVHGNNYSKSDFKNSDFGIPIGVCYDISGCIQLGLSYNFGLTNISGTGTNNLALRNNWGSLTMAFLIR